MCSKIEHFTPFLKNRIMSDSDTNNNNNPQIFPVQKDKEELTIIPQNSSETVSIEALVKEDEEKAALDTSADHVRKEEVGHEATTVSSSSGKEIMENDNNDGFRTPDHKIPALTKCPPAPRKARPQPSNLKRKASQLDITTEVDSFLEAVSERDDLEDEKMKKVRRENEDIED